MDSFGGFPDWVCLLMESCEHLVRRYISCSHGGLIDFNKDALRELLTDDFEFENECEKHGAKELLDVFTFWSATVKQENTEDKLYNNVVIDHLFKDPASLVVSATWRTFYTTKDSGAFYYDQDVSGRTVKDFRVVSFFTCTQQEEPTSNAQPTYRIKHILQRSDSARRHLLKSDQ